MTPDLLSATAGAVSSICALLTVYMYRSYGKGFVWTKDHTISLIADKQGKVSTQVAIPLFNFGKGTIQFIELKAKKINLENNSMENFETNMHEAYFPEGVQIVSYQTAIHNEKKPTHNQQILISRGAPEEVHDVKEYQDQVNKSLNEIPEHILILKCKYKDGSFFGLRTKETVIGLSIQGMVITYLSTERRKELNQFFSW
jgi:hypothetical protein